MASGGTFRFAIIGAGGISNAHGSAVRANSQALAISAVVDPIPASRAKLVADHSAEQFDSVEQFLSARESGRVQVDGVVVCTPPSSRVPIVEKCLRAGLHVLAEKPIAHTLSDAKKLAEMAAQFPKLVTALAYCHRFTPAIEQMKALTAAGKIGTLTRFENCFATYFPALREKWMSDPAVSGGGAFNDTGCHALDIFLFLVGTPKVQACVRNYAWEKRGETSATTIVKSAAQGSSYPGVGGVILSGWLERDRFTVALVGTEGTLSYDYLNPTELVFQSVRAGTPEIIAVETHEVRFARQLLAFADAAANGSKTVLATFAEGALTAEAVDAAGRG